MKKTFRPGALALALTTALMTACSMGTQEVSVDSELESRQAALTQQEAELQRRQQELEARENELRAQQSAAHNHAPAPMAAGNEMLPPNAKPGECYTRVWVEPQYRTVTERVRVSDASERIEVVPAKYAKVKKRVLVEEESTKLVTVPATYKTVTQRVLVKPAGTRIEQIPATYETVTERVLDKPAHTTWKKGTGPIQRIDDTTGEIMCLVEVPASYKTVTRRVLKSPATTREVEIPAVYKTVTKRVVDQPATTREVVIPAKYTTIEVEEEVQPAQEKRIAIPEEFKNVTRRELVSEGRMEWRSILCETNTTPERITKIQQALLKAGYNPGPIDGDIGAETMRAVNAYQRDKGLPVDKYLNIETVKSLGVSPN
ncbi:peptidoglycan-binding domain-containing protein [Granulosicoccaceae sp. 1_MG-2023]|nr:peptidoglycan-binding domain-containing protein [Granulosicoccaceae sp. 1_MG-2023]